MSAVLMCFLEERVTGGWAVPAQYIRPCDPVEDPKEEGQCAKPFWYGVNSTLVFLLSGQLRQRAAALEPLPLPSHSGMPEDASPELREYHALLGDTAGPPFWIPANAILDFRWDRVIPTQDGDRQLEPQVVLFLDAFRKAVAGRPAPTHRMVSWLVW